MHKHKNKSTVILSAVLTYLVLATFIFLPTYAADENKNETPTVKQLEKSTPAVTASAIDKKAKELINEPISFTELAYNELYDIDSSLQYLHKVNEAIEVINTANNSGDYTKTACASMTAELTRLQEVANNYYNDIVCYTTWEHDYSYAAKTWEFFKQRGYSDAAVFGIIGNMMIETSGGSILLEPAVYNPSRNYYGLCQWSTKYYPEVKDKPFEEQLVFLDETIETEFSTFGKLYSNGFDLEDFKNMTDPADAALAFAKVYERCGSGSYTLRMQAAVNAESYFNK